MVKKRICCCIVSSAKIVNNFFIESNLLIHSKKVFNPLVYGQEFLENYREQAVQSSVNCDVVLSCKRIRFEAVDELRAGFHLEKKGFSLSKKANLKIIFHYDVTNLLL